LKNPNSMLSHKKQSSNGLMLKLLEMNSEKRMIIEKINKK